MKTTAAIVITSALALLAGCAGAPSAGMRPVAPAAAAATTGAPVCMPIQRGVNGDVSDTRIAERWPDRSYGDQSVAFSGTVGSAARYTLLDFDLSAIPEGAEITRATITLQETTLATSRATVTAHRITTAWNEGTVTWNTFGAAFDAYPEAKLTVQGGEEAPATFEVTRLVRAWRSGEQAQHGVLLKQEDSSSSFATSESDSPTQRPRLDVCFTVPGGRS